MFKWLKRSQASNASFISAQAERGAQLRQDGNAMLEREDLHGAEACYREVIALDPKDGLAQFHLALVLSKRHCYAEAFTVATSAIAMSPSNADGHYLLGSLYEQRGDLLGASRHFQRAFSLRPNFELACRDACRVLCHLGQMDELPKLLASGLALNPKSADFHFYEGNLYYSNEILESALTSYREALSLGADSSALHGYIGGILVRKNSIGASFEHLLRAIELDDKNTMAHHDIGLVHNRMGNVDEAIQHQEITINQDPTQLQAYSCLFFALGSTDQYSPQKHLYYAKAYTEQVHKSALPLPPIFSSPSVPRKLRVGWVSGDFRKHVNIAFLKHLLAGLQKEPVELVAFSNNPYDDDVTKELKSLMQHWHDIRDLSDHDAAKAIHSCCVDILIDLSGHTGHNRLPVFAWRPAPTQVSWLGYFASTWLPEVDYLIADPISVPGHLHHQFSERIWYLPETRLCMSPPAETHTLAVSNLPAAVNGNVTFGSFQSLSKINDRVLSTWGQVLSALPHSRLRLQIRDLDLPGVRERLLGRILQAGIPTTRVMLLSGVSVSEYLAAHHEVDIILDTFPYPGGTTTAEALWMGVPTITLEGNSLLARQGASMLANAGLQDWIANSHEAYIERAIHFASNISALAKLRSRLRQQVLASPLFDSSRFTAHFLAALRAMHRDALSR
jgi:predicted O-linked N-acetylglucosamine transferase (SPINDLY family)